MGGLSIWHWLIVLLVVVLIFLDGILVVLTWTIADAFRGQRGITAAAGSGNAEESSSK